MRHYTRMTRNESSLYFAFVVNLVVLMFSLLVTLSPAVPDVLATYVPPPRPIGKIVFWFYSATAIDDFLEHPDHGVTALVMGYPQIAGAQGAKRVHKAHADGLAVISGLPGDPGLAAGTYEKSMKVFEAHLEYYASIGVDAVYVDEPYGPALNDPRECGSGCFKRGVLTYAAVRWIDMTYNRLGDHFHALRPGGKFGICYSYVPFHIETLQAGLRADFVCMETYGNSTYRHLQQIKSSIPKVMSDILVVYGSKALCDNLRGGGRDSVDSWAFWDLDNYSHWVPGKRLFDPNWESDAKAFAAGDTSFCTKYDGSRPIPIMPLLRQLPAFR